MPASEFALLPPLLRLHTTKQLGRHLLAEAPLGKVVPSNTVLLQSFPLASHSSTLQQQPQTNAAATKFCQNCYRPLAQCCGAALCVKPTPNSLNYHSTLQKYG